MAGALVLTAGATALAPFAGNLLSLDLSRALTIVPTLLRVSHALPGAGRRRDERLARRMTELMRERAARDTGRLQSGITYYFEDGSWVVQASAQRDPSSADYARLVEFGTRAGERRRRITQASREGFFAADPFDTTGRRGRPASRTRRQGRTHPGTDAQPFFFPSAREVLAQARRALTPELDAVAVEFAR